jgi:hypothetical protein
MTSKELSKDIKPEQGSVELTKKDLDASFYNIKENSKDSNVDTFGQIIVGQLLNVGFAGKDPTEQLRNILDGIKNISPKDHIEGMLVAQMLAVHNAIMNNLHLVSTITRNSAKANFINISYNTINKLTRTYAMQVEALARYRAKGQQKIIVEHLQVNSGGQAVIGNVNKTNVINGGR